MDRPDEGFPVHGTTRHILEKSEGIIPPDSLIPAIAGERLWERSNTLYSNSHVDTEINIMEVETIMNVGAIYARCELHYLLGCAIIP